MNLLSVFKSINMRTADVSAPQTDLRQQAIVTYGDIVSDFSEKEIKYLLQIGMTMQRLPEVKVVYDIGANNGIWSQAFAAITKGSVFAFEPIKDLADEISSRRSRFPEISVINAACGQENRKSIIHRDNNKHEASSLLEMTSINQEEFSQYDLGDSIDEEVNVIRLDDWSKEVSAPVPDLIKVDVQGYENQVIAGGVNTFKKARYLWLELNFKEFYKDCSTVNTLIPVLYDLGFQLIDCIDLVRSRHSGELLYMDGIFRNLNTANV